MKLKPSHFCDHPWSSVLDKSEAETIARNIMVIQKLRGDNWGLTWGDYKATREQHGGFSMKEKEYFDKVQPYVNSPEGAMRFSPTWRKAAEKARSA